MRRALLLLLLAACSEKPAVPAGCSTDEDCGLGSGSCCPPCPGEPPSAGLRSVISAAQQANQCRIKHCGVSPDCRSVVGPVPSYVAACEAGSCVARRIGPPPVFGPPISAAAPPKVAPAPAPAPACVADADCLISELSCCGCPAEPQARSRAEEKRLGMLCGMVTCGAPKKPCPRLKHRPDELAAACDAGSCTAVLRAPPDGGSPKPKLHRLGWCDADADCVVTDYQSCCGCRSWMALSRAETRMRDSHCARMGACIGDQHCPDGGPLRHRVARCQDNACVLGN